MTRITHGYEELYFDWLVDKVPKPAGIRRHSYNRLLNKLHNTEFYYILPMDDDRGICGMDLRYRFAYSNKYDVAEVRDAIDISYASVLEMMIALCIRIEDSIMSNLEEGDRTGMWFWEMITNLGLIDSYDSRYDEEYVDYILNRFMHREYERDGRGGLFYVVNPYSDMRTVEIWYQCMWYLNEVIGGRHD